MSPANDPSSANAHDVGAQDPAAHEPRAHDPGAHDPAAATSAVELLDEPPEGTPGVIEDTGHLDRACAALGSGTGPVAVDTERASGFRYFQRAYLIQLRRRGAGSHLIDPVALAGGLAPLQAVLGEAEWVVHAATQDLPCLAEVGLLAPAVFDTELAARLAGYPRVGLGSLTEELLGYRLQKGHSAVDWSARPLPAEWLTYAALDVEPLLGLRETLAAELDRQGQLDWAYQEFEAVRTAPPAAARGEPWRRTSGIHRVRTRRGLAIVRALWHARDELARRRDRAPARMLPDRAIIAAASAPPASTAELMSLPAFGGRNQRKHARSWLAQITAATGLASRELPELARPSTGPPPPSRWAARDPEAAARLAAARTGLAELAEAHQVPVENVLLPELVRTLCWSPPAEASTSAVAELLARGGARAWQVELTAGMLASALATTAPDRG